MYVDKMALLGTPAVTAIAIAGFILFVTRLLAARKAVRKLEAAKAPMPKHHPIFGHLAALKESIQGLPRDCTMHVVIKNISKRFPNGVFYMDLWPFSRTLMVITSHTAATQVENAFLDKPASVTAPLEILTAGPSLITMHGGAWKKWRGLFNPGFSAGYMIGLAPAIADEVAVFCRLLQDQAKQSSTFQLEEYTLRLTFDIITHVALDSRIHYQTAPHLLPQALRNQILWTSFGTTFNPVRRYLSPRPFVHWWNSRKINRYLAEEVGARFEEQRQDFKKPQGDQRRSKSVLSLALNKYLQEEGDRGEASKITFIENAIPQLRAFLFAGHDTTSSTLQFCFFVLSKYPEVLGRIRVELDQVFSTDSSIDKVHDVIEANPQLLNQIPYTFAVIKEVLRLYPPAGALREGRAGFVVADEEGHRYPTEGCNVWILPLAIHHNPKIFVKPDEFIPERWTVGPEDPLYPPKGAWRVFEWGPRACIGQTLALLELRVALVMTTRLFDIKPAYEEWDEMHPPKGEKMVDGERCYQCEKGGGTSHPSDGFPCKVTLRT
ncbi:AflN/verA/monooxygenase [Lophiotrema nucula]|uniref:AflN/verA/monooxygenase n=1 Tax=Lophiotrema nucula TaxID=690887 RepID=A0A6A5ZIA8_9PLEO|nr:AflN/verA/monooxygenase [Lophiotrema nucula]